MTRDTSVRDTDTIQEETEGKIALQRLTMTRETSVRDTDTIQEAEGKRALQGFAMTREACLRDRHGTGGKKRYEGLIIRG